MGREGTSRALQASRRKTVLRNCRARQRLGKSCWLGRATMCSSCLPTLLGAAGAWWPGGRPTAHDRERIPSHLRQLSPRRRRRHSMPARGSSPTGCQADTTTGRENVAYEFVDDSPYTVDPADNSRGGMLAHPSGLSPEHDASRPRGARRSTRIPRVESGREW